jgi:hypothetical protein
MTEITMIVVIMAGLLTILDWRNGLVACVVVGILQDPLRKVAPGQPLYYVVLVGVILGMAMLRAFLLNVNLGPRAILGVRRDLKLPFKLFLGLVVAQAMHSFLAYGSALMTGIGLLVWLAPIPAIVFAYQFALRRGADGVRRWMLVYVVFAMASLSGVYFEYSGFTWAALGEVGEGLPIYDLGTVLKAHSGFFRSSEIAAWHTAAMSCFIFTLSVGKRATLVRVASALALIAVLVSLGILTGRRKMLVEILIFMGTYLFLYASLQRGAARLAAGAIIASVAGYILVVGFVEPDLVETAYTKSMTMENANRVEGYAMRGQSVFADLPNRVSTMGIDPVMWSIKAHGWLGAGLGTGSQGTQAVADAFGIRRGAAEGGLGKVTMELGLPGLFLVIWLVFMLGRQIRTYLAHTAALSAEHTRLAFGLVAFLTANVATFSIATQAYSDLFVLLVLGWSLGFTFAMPVLAQQSAQKRADAAQARAAAYEAALERLPRGAETQRPT